MKKFRIILLLLLTFYLKNVSAICNYETQAKLNSEAATIKATYEVLSKERDKSEYVCGDGNENCVAMVDYFKITILNVSENFYVTVKGDNNFSKTFTYNNVKDGVITFEVDDISNVNTYTFNVYSSSKSGCDQKLNRTFYLTTPRYNEYSQSVICDEIPSYYMCEKYVTYEDNGYEDFILKSNEYKDKQDEEIKKENKTFFEKILSFIVANKLIFIIGISALIIIVVIVVIVIKKRRKDII